MSPIHRLALISSLCSLAAVALASDRPAVPGGIDDKPYLGRGGASVVIGGYMDHEFEWLEDGGNTFDQHRFVPFLTAHVSDRVSVSMELELEHGGNPDAGGEIKLEYGVMDYRLRDGLSFRGGVILSPLGLFNLRHDSPLNDLTERPTVNRQIMPSTLSESGMGFFGTFYPSDDAVLSYEIYLVNGFDEGVLSGNDGGKKLRVRDGRGSQKSDNNENKALAGRLGWSPALGLDFGASVHTGKYDDLGEKNLSIVGLDGTARLGNLDLRGELGLVSADVDRTAEPALAESQRGHYLEAAYHVLHDRFLAGSVVTLVVRHDLVDYDTDVDGDQEQGLTLGANFRPTEETAFKLDWTRTWSTARGATEKDDGRDRVFFSFATYF
ncbi:MAG TPA: hypothetical protein P5571_12700 [Candidatus Krumholzibacteria bacterium]|mgnify:CR=1 FL=1|nr:hypothetical protein [Candidatus Krumholzibacteria bacterium]HRX52221.1 hypothetical protein [Candidatus Krumholzibacteria bacterium]